MNQESIMSQVLTWPLHQQIEFMEALWSSIAGELSGDDILSDEQHQILLHRLADDNENPDELVSWDEVKALLQK